MKVQVIRGNFHGTGADLYLQLGNVPFYFTMWKLETNTPDTIVWCDVMGADDECVEGFLRPYGGADTDDYTFGNGVSPYYGGELLNTTNQPSVVYGHANVDYIERDDKDYRLLTDTATGAVGDAYTTDIITWTLDTAGTPSGHFNGAVTGTFINDGSIIRIQPANYQYVATARIVNSALSNSGTVADSVKLSWAVPSGDVQFIGGQYGYKPSAIGTVTRPGILINETTVNASAKMVGFMAMCEVA